MSLLQQAKKFGVKRFVPSEFTVSLKNINCETEDPLLTSRIRFRGELEKSGVKGLFIHTGLFYDSYFDIIKRGGMYFGTKPDQKVDLTFIEDAALYIAEVVANPNSVGEFNFAAEELTPLEIADMVKSIYGDFEMKQVGDYQDLRQKALDFKKEGKFIEATYYLYALHALDGSGKMQKIDNSKFGNISPMGMEEFLKGVGKCWFSKEGERPTV